MIGISGRPSYLGEAKGSTLPVVAVYLAHGGVEVHGQQPVARPRSRSLDTEMLSQGDGQDKLGG
jgi:hypothetical protein